MDLSNYIITPKDCILALCIPATKRSFVTNLNSGNNIDFTRRNLLRMYHAEFLKPARNAIKSISNKGVAIVQDCTLSDFKFTLQKNFKVLILFAHMVKDKIEFYDGLYDSATINSLIPDGKAFIFDLNVCFCDDLAELVGATKINVLVKYGELRKTIPLKWILFYEYFFELIRQKPLTYLDAVQITFNKFYKIFSQ